MKLVWTLGFVVSGLTAAMGCSGDDGDGGGAPPPVSIDGWEAEAPAPVVSGASVSSSFTVRGDGTRAFGGCLVIDAHGGKACSTAADCATGAVITPATGHYEYCIGAAGAAQGTCWTRNGEDTAWCNKLPPPGHDAGTFTLPAVDAAQLTGKTRWMTLVCLNAGTYPAFSDGPRPPCGSEDPAAKAYKVYYASEVTEYAAP